MNAATKLRDIARGLTKIESVTKQERLKSAATKLKGIVSDLMEIESSTQTYIGGGAARWRERPPSLPRSWRERTRRIPYDVNWEAGRTAAGCEDISNLALELQNEADEQEYLLNLLD